MTEYLGIDAAQRVGSQLGTAAKCSQEYENIKIDVILDSFK